MIVYNSVYQPLWIPVVCAVLFSWVLLERVTPFPFSWGTSLSAATPPASWTCRPRVASLGRTCLDDRRQSRSSRRSRTLCCNPGLFCSTVQTQKKMIRCDIQRWWALSNICFFKVSLIYFIDILFTYISMVILFVRIRYYSVCTPVECATNNSRYK